MMTFDEAAAIFSYNKDTGDIHWLSTRAPNALKGTVLRSPTGNGYYRVRINGEKYFLHRLAWLLGTGQWPLHSIDHINGDRSDNRLSNLRDVCHSTNMQNIRSARSHSGTGLMGVQLHRKKWQAKITSFGVRHYLGAFETAEEAQSAYLDAKRKLHKGCTI